MKSNGQPMPPGFDRFKSFSHDGLTANHCYFRYSRPYDVDGINVSDKEDQATKHYSFYLNALCKKNNVLWPGHLYQQF